MKKYRVRLGKSPQLAHSYRDFSKLSQALAYLWAMAQVSRPVRAWLFQGADGWLNNEHMKNKPTPATLAAQVAQYIAEDEAIELVPWFT